MRVRIKKLPNQSMAYGGRVFNQVAPNALPDKTSEPDHRVKKVLEPVSREDANIEAEKGETAFILNEDGLPAHYKIGGKRHSNGGTPLNVPEDTFIFSDTKSMTIKDPRILKFFGETKPKTPAKIAEKYDMNQYRKVLSDKNTDKLQKQTAEKMIENYTMVLGKLALVQESMKGFPQGIPMIAQPYMAMNNISPEMILPQSPQKGQQMQGQEEEMMEGPMSNPQEEMVEQQAPQQMGQEMMPQQEMQGGPEMQFAPGGFYTDPPKKGDPYHVWLTEIKHTKDTGKKFNEGITSANTQLNLRNPNDITRSYAQSGKLGEFDYFSSPGGTDLSWSGPFGKKRHYMYSDNPLVGAAAELFINPKVDRASGANPFSTNSFGNLKRFISTGNPQGIYANGGATQTRKVRIKALPNNLRRMQVGGAGPIDNSTIVEDLSDGKKLIEVKTNGGSDFYVYDYNSGTAVADGASADEARLKYIGQASQGSKSSSTSSSNTGTGSTSSSSSSSSSNTGKGSRGRGGRGDYMKYNQDFWDEYSRLAQEGKIIPDVPQINFESEEDRKRDLVQGERPGNPNIYGDRDWNKGQEFEDFKRRQKWFFDKNPDFNPNNAADVKKFQDEYCKRSAEFGMSKCHFLSKGPSGTGYDGKFGEHTWSAPGFNEAEPVRDEPKPQIINTPPKPQDPIQPVALEQPYIPNQALKFYPQDLANIMGVMGQQIYKPKTWYAPLLYNTPDVAYITPDYSPLMEQANISTQGINAYGSRQSADASMSAIQGKVARQAADHNLQVANVNAGIYNNWQNVVANTLNANKQYNAAQAQMTFDAAEAYKADYVKARNKKLADMINMGNTALTNAVETYNLNQLYPHYQIDPGRGGIAYFNRGEALKAQQNANYSKKLQEYKMWKEAYPGMDDDTIAKFMAAKDSGVYSTTPGYTNPMDVPGGYTPT